MWITTKDSHPETARWSFPPIGPIRTPRRPTRRRRGETSEMDGVTVTTDYRENGKRNRTGHKRNAATNLADGGKQGRANIAGSGQSETGRTDQRKRERGGETGKREHCGRPGASETWKREHCGGRAMRKEAAGERTRRRGKGRWWHEDARRWGPGEGNPKRVARPGYAAKRSSGKRATVAGERPG